MKRLLTLIVIVVVIGALLVGANAYAATKYTVNLTLHPQMGKLRIVGVSYYANVSVGQSSLTEYLLEGKGVRYWPAGGYMVVTGNLTIGDHTYQKIATVEWENDTTPQTLQYDLKLKWAGVDELGNATVDLWIDTHNQLYYDNLDGTRTLWWDNQTWSQQMHFDAALVYTSGSQVISTFG